ncbi:ATP-dependent DNA helicase CHL1 [Erysiphe neolycopersici]|uniref:ATP-dependent DNA helicase CHL1 n=1 Tax=Erysiphe neolycopersici TaxID=212602 RepID=A0A420HA27_9PEZI|nr:ATP-dependent DNA helicase CHL1 [Erysiphe neolycopersici]
MEEIKKDEVEKRMREFYHPYEPYSIQLDFMEVVYSVLENERVGILESPTGTGKSLSLICGALTWLRDHKKKLIEISINTEGEPEWVIEQAKARRRKELLAQREEMEAKLVQIRLKEKSQRDQYLKGEESKTRNPSKRRKIAQGSNSVVENDESLFVLDEYESDQDHLNSQNSGNRGSDELKKNNGSSLYSNEILALLNQLGMGTGSSTDIEKDLEIEDEVKIFYSSRTHSQLTQFINELRRPKFPSSITGITTQECSSSLKEQEIDLVKHVTLGSRKNLCINPKVRQLGSLTSINERCMELQQSSTPKDKKCTFLPNKDNQPLVHSFRDHALASIQDIEDMNALGKEIGICPYYASRAAIRPAEIVTLPYPLLLQKSARDALGISLKGHVVIIDEAHNLMDAISNTYSVQISLKQLKTAREQLGVYLQKFRNRLKGKNRVYVAQVVRVIDSISGYLEKQLAAPENDGVVQENDLLSGKGVDQINLFKLIHYLQESKLARKVEAYTKFKKANDEVQWDRHPAESASISDTSASVIHQLTSVLFALTHPQNEGRLFFAKKSPDQIMLLYLLLDPSNHFKDIVSSARAVILSGGTMSPMTDYTSHLFPYLEQNRITTLSCGHVIPKSNLLAWNISRGPSGQDFEFTFGRRNNGNMIDDLGRAILNICQVVPDGVIVFFPSYHYLNSVLARWSSGQENGISLLKRLETKKHVLQESKDVSVDQVLQNYAQAIDSGSGGLLLSVVGGKMSEGINFSDALGRCVVIVGLPYPNINSAEWKAKIEYIENSHNERSHAQFNMNRNGIEKEPACPERAENKIGAKDVSRDFYENACMRAVNQSIGRAIRHKGDYAAIVMIDKRFGADRIKKKLPGWIKEGLVADAGEKNFGILMGRLSTFFGSRKLNEKKKTSNSEN